MVRAIKFAGWSCGVKKMGRSRVIICDSPKSEVRITPFRTGKKISLSFGTVRIKGAVKCTVGKSRNVVSCDYWQVKTPKRAKKKSWKW